MFEGKVGVQNFQSTGVNLPKPFVPLKWPEEVGDKRRTIIMWSRYNSKSSLGADWVSD